MKPSRPIDEAIRLDPKIAASWRQERSALAEQGKYNEAIKAYDEAIRLDPNDATAWNIKGIALIKQGKYDEAIKAFNEAIKLDPNLGAALNQPYDEAIRLDPNYAKAWYNKGILSMLRASTTSLSRLMTKPSG